MRTTINTGHPLMNTNDERIRIRAVLKHLGSGADLRDFPATSSEKVALVKTASNRKLIAWHKNRSRYELTPAGWCELAPTRRFGVATVLVGSAAGAAIGAVALGVFWVAAGASHLSPPRVAAVRPAVAVNVASMSAPAVDGALASSGPVEPSVAVEAATAAPGAAPVEPTPPAPAAVPAREAAPAAPAPAAEPTNVAEQRPAEQPSAEERAERAAKAKQAAAAKKARQRAAARRRREEAARSWAATEPSRGRFEPSGTRQAEYSGFGGYSGYSGYGGQGSWFAYR